MRLTLIWISVVVVSFGIWLASVPISGGSIHFVTEREFWGFSFSHHAMVSCHPGRAGIVTLLPGHGMRLGFLDIDTPY